MWRWEVIAQWLKEKNPLFGAEIGVKEGRFISHLLENFPELTMYAVDPWEEQPEGNEDYREWDFNNIYNRYKAAVKPYSDRVIELREYSETAADKIPDGSLDFVFIDAQHDYYSCKRDIALWLPKVKKGGLLSGHDYNPKFPGVIRAVDEEFKPITGLNDVWGVWC